VSAPPYFFFECFESAHIGLLRLAQMVFLIWRPTTLTSSLGITETPGPASFHTRSIRKSYWARSNRPFS